jgi:DNA (cytosine-5)-methyltransferase 1
VKRKKSYSFKFIDLFAGIGGFHIACHNNGGRCVFASEKDKFARQTYTANFKDIAPDLFNKKGEPTKYFAGDITKVDIDDIPDFDVLCAGFPCQPFSNVGLKKGFEDTRGTLFFDIARIIEAKQPKAFLLENVRGLLNHDDGKTFKVITKTIKKLGYNFHYQVIRASDYGVPQHRPRLYMVGIRKDIKDDFKFPEPVPLKFNLAKVFNGKTCNAEISRTLRVGGRRSGLNDRRNWDTYLVDGKEVFIGIEEAKKLQGFPNEFVFPVSEMQAMKQLGNSIAIPAAQAIIKEIKKTINKKD